MSKNHFLPNRVTSFPEAYKPAEIAALVETAGVNKARLPAPQMLVLAVLAGVFIGFGAAAYTMVMTGLDASDGPSRLLGGLVFSLGLILVIVGGAELFTGNALMVMAVVDHKVSLQQLFRSWTIVFVGNLIGATGLAIAIGWSGLLDQSMGETAIAISRTKLSLPLSQAFVRGILCNALVCLAIWLTFAARTAAGKILAIIWPVSAFVLLGLEHSIANLYFFPQTWAADAKLPAVPVLQNLASVTAGNIVGGGFGVALAYRFAYLGARKTPSAGAD